MPEPASPVRAAVFDVYGTLLSVAPMPAGAGTEARWRELCERRLGRMAEHDWGGLMTTLQALVRQEHRAARARGIVHPEVDWPALMTVAVPELATLPEADRDAFLLEEAGLRHGIGLMPGADWVLRRLAGEGVVLGIASNAQKYTFAELETALAGSGLGRAMFDPELCFWSFERGFGKPDPQVFRSLGARLAARGVAPHETLMIGDRADNDVGPARAEGWRTWELSEAPATNPGGNWRTFEAWWDAGAPGPG